MKIINVKFIICNHNVIRKSHLFTQTQVYVCRFINWILDLRHGQHIPHMLNNWITNNKSKKIIRQLKIKDSKDLHKIMLNNKLESSTSTLYI